MKGDPEFVILKHTAWLPTPQYETEILGSIVRYPLKPSNDYVPPSPLQYNTLSSYEGILKNFLFTNTATKSHDVSLALKSVAGFAFKGNTEDAVHMAGKLVRYRRLTQHEQFWRKLRANGKVVEEVPGWISLFNTWPPCLVVGIMTASAVNLDFSGATSRERNGTLEFPLTTVALAAAGVPLPPGLTPETGDPKVGAGTAERVARVFRATVPDEAIFALELRIVTTAMLRKRELALKEDGPKFEPGRLAGDGEGSSSEDEGEPPAVEDLILEGFTEKEYGQMIG